MQVTTAANRSTCSRSSWWTCPILLQTTTDYVTSKQEFSLWNNEECTFQFWLHSCNPTLCNSGFVHSGGDDMRTLFSGFKVNLFSETHICTSNYHFIQTQKPNLQIKVLEDPCPQSKCDCCPTQSLNTFWNMPLT